MKTKTIRKGAIHVSQALLLLESGKPCDLRLWKLATGDILRYEQVQCIGHFYRGGTYKVVFPLSRQIRRFRTFTLFEINGMEIYL